MGHICFPAEKRCLPGDEELSFGGISEVLWLIGETKSKNLEELPLALDSRFRGSGGSLTNPT